MLICITDDTINAGVIITIFKRLHTGFILILDLMKVLETLDQ